MQSRRLSAVALRNAGHIGRVGDWAEMAAAKDWCRFTSSMPQARCWWRPMVASSGGCRRRPIASAFRAMDSGRSCWISRPRLSPKARCWSQAAGGKKLPKDALIDLDGNLSEDPAVLYGPHSAEGPRDHSQGKGAIRAFGEHKGSGLAFICELLGRRVDRHRRHGPNRRFANGMSLFMSIPRWSIPVISSMARFRATSPTSRTPSRPPVPMPC